MPGNLLGGPITRSHHPSYLEPGLREIFTINYPKYDSGILEQVYVVRSSEKKTETDAVTAELGLLLPKPEGGAPQTDAMQEFYTKSVTHMTWALAIEFTEEAIEDNLYIDLMQRGGRALARSAAYTRQVQAFDFFNDLTMPIFTVDGTGYTLLDTDFPLLNGGTWSNRPINPTTLSEAALAERLQAWTVDMVDPRGLKINTRPRMLMVGPSNEFLAHRLVNSALRPGTADNDTNPIRDLRKLEVVVNPHLTDDGRWFLIGMPEETGLRYFDRVPAQIRPFDGGEVGNRKFRARMRNSHHAVHPYNIMGSPAS